VLEVVAAGAGTLVDEGRAEVDVDMVVDGEVVGRVYLGNSTAAAPP
jgi:hypothetical protein